MFKLHYTLLFLSMGVFSHMVESEMQHDTTVDLATVLTRVNVLESGLHSTMDDLAATKTELQTTKTRLQDQERYSSSMNSSLNVLQQQQENCSSSLSALKTELAAKTKIVAFNVYLKSGGIPFAKNVPVKFGGVHYNAGNGYRTSTGKFTAPVSGTYIFSTEMEVGNSPRYTYIRIILSEYVVTSGWGQLTQDNSVITVPTTAITHVRQGQQVWVETSNDVYLYTGSFSSHFVGALLSPD